MVLATTGPRRVARASSKNVGDSERAVSAAVGGLFVASGLKKRGLGGLALAIIGAELVRRGATGHCMFYDAIGFDGNEGESRDDVRSAAATVNARRSIKVERSVRIRRSADELYGFWRNFANLPRVLDGLASVTSTDEEHSHWVATGRAGLRIEWDSEIVNDIPGELIAWKTIGHPDVAHAGSVHFTEIGDETEVRLVMDYEPVGGRLEGAAAMMTGESPDRRVQRALDQLKTLFEGGYAPLAPTR